MEVKKHRLGGEKVDPFQKAKLFGGTINPDSIIIHYTAGPSGDATVRLFKKTNRTVSAHLVSHEDGRVTQMVDFNRRAYHAGKSSYNGRVGYNAFSIGIEISNPGYLVKNPKGDGYVTWWEKKKTTPKTAPEDMVFEGEHRNPKLTPMKFWYKYPEEQIKSVYAICEALCQAYDIKEILGHEEIAPGRKADPGPAFPLDDLRKTMFEKYPIPSPKELPEGTEGTVSAKLNIRSAPKAESEKIAAALPKDTKVQMLKEFGDWYFVNAEISGWVSRDYINTDDTDSEYDGIVSAGTLNIRKEPSGSAEKIAKPLSKGTGVEITQQVDHWYQVKAKIQGWVVKKYITDKVKEEVTTEEKKA